MSHPKTLASLLSFLALATQLAAQLDTPRGPKVARPSPGPVVVGTSAPITLEPRLENAVENAGTLLYGDLVVVPDASFLKAHFVNVNLRVGDVLVLKSKSGALVEEIRGRGPKDMGTFWALSAFGDELELEFRFARAYDRVPFRIDQVIVGDPALLDVPIGEPDSICAPANFENVICYQADPGKWSNVLASVGVMSVGGNPASALFCSGSNVSPANYLLTNNHCITNQGGCDSSEFVFKYYRQSCGGGATTPDWQGFRCDEVVATSPFSSCDQGLGDLDYTLSSVIGNPAATFGYAQPDPVRLTDGEAIYIIQHPAGRPHEIAHGSGSDVDVSGTVLRYYDTLDTEGGSSGSPIYRESDDKLVGLHHCGGCETPGVGNRGMLMADIYPEIQAFLCAGAVELEPAPAAAFTQVHGDDDAVLEPGEVWSFVPRVQNRACSLVALGATAEVRVSAGSLGQAWLVSEAVAFGDIAAGATADALAPVKFRIPKTATCGATIAFDLVNLAAVNGGPFAGQTALVSATLGERAVDAVLADDFTIAPNGWTIEDLGSGTGPAATWTRANPGGRVLALVAPFYIADSGALGAGNPMDERLISRLLDCSAAESVQLQYAHDFRRFTGGATERGDVEIRSTATAGAWVRVAFYAPTSASGTVQLDVTAQAAGQSDVQVRFRYYNANGDNWWAIDDVFLIGTGTFACDVFGDQTFGGQTPVPPGTGTRP